MSLTTLDLPSEPDELRAYALALRAELAGTKAELSSTTHALSVSASEVLATRRRLQAAEASVQLITLEIAKLKAQLAKLKRLQFGQSSEQLNRIVDQLELQLEDLETSEAAAISAATDAGVAAPEVEPRKARRLPLPEQLPRRDVVHPAPGGEACACGGRMTALGENVTEVLEYVLGRFEVIRHEAPRIVATTSILL